MDRRRVAREQLPPMELAIMHILWRSAPLSVQAVQSQLGQGLAYTTVQTVLNTMTHKKRLKRELVGKAYAYSPCLSRTVAVRRALSDLIDRTFQGSVEDLLVNLIDNKQVDKDMLRRLTALIDEAEVCND